MISISVLVFSTAKGNITKATRVRLNCTGGNPPRTILMISVSIHMPAAKMAAEPELVRRCGIDPIATDWPVIPPADKSRNSPSIGVV